MSAGTASRVRTVLKAKRSSPASNCIAKRLAFLVALVSPATALCDGGSRLTRRVVEGFFTCSTRMAFGHGGDCFSDVIRRGTE